MGKIKLLNIKKTVLNKPEGIDIVLTVVRAILGSVFNTQPVFVPVISSDEEGKARRGIFY